MLTRNQIKYIKSLSRKSIRSQERKFVVEGMKLCEELLNSGFVITTLFVVDGFNMPNNLDVSVTYISNKDLERITQLKTPNTMLAVVEMPHEIDWGDLSEGRYLFLDRINDPGNLGTIIRMADWFGIEQIFCSQRSVDVFNSKTIQSSMGSVFRIPVQYVEGVEFLKHYSNSYPNNTIWSAEMKGAPLQNVDFSSNGLIIMGSESHGVDPDYNQYIGQKVTIPSFGEAESLNVGVASGIFLWEIMRSH